MAIAVWAALAGFFAGGPTGMVAIPAMAGIIVLFGYLLFDSDRRLARANQNRVADAEMHLKRCSDHVRIVKRELPALNFCIEELERRVAGAGPQEWIWKTKLKVARLLRREWSDRIDIEPRKLMDDERTQMLAEHPLLHDHRTPASNPTDRNAEDEWFKEIRSEVMDFIEKEKNRGE